MMDFTLRMMGCIRTVLVDLPKLMGFVLKNDGSRRSFTRTASVASVRASSTRRSGSLRNQRVSLDLFPAGDFVNCDGPSEGLPTWVKEGRVYDAA